VVPKAWLILLLSSLAWRPAAPVAQTPAPVRIVLVGDSTVTDDSGWGLGFKQMLGDRAECINTAANGRSSKSFIDEGRWRAALALHGDYYLIQFGHNDQPGKGADRETDPATTFPQNITRFVDDVRAMGATPVLVTSLTRRTFDPSGRRITSTLTPWVDAVKRVGAARRVPVIDLDASSVALSERLGAAALEEFSPKTASGDWDTTHLNAKGSLLFGRLVVDELRQKVPVLVPYLRLDPAPAESIHMQRQEAAATQASQTSTVTWDQALKQPAAWYATAEAARVARNVLLYQRNTGGWPKNLEMAAILSPDETEKIRSEKGTADSTIDNGATTAQLRYLAMVQAAAGDPSVRAGLLAGVDYLLAAQYPNGGWPQYYPLRANYSRHITFNDDAMTRVMTLLADLAAGKVPFDVVDAGRRSRASAALERGIAITLRLQIRVGGRLTGWCQQYDEETLAPAGARAYEHPSIASMETVALVRFLMSVDRPAPAIVASVEGAVDWLRRSLLS